MKQAYLWIAGIVSTAAVAGGSIAVMQSPPAQLPQPDPVALSPSTSTEAPVKNNSASSDNTPAETSPNPPQPDPKLSDFPHRRLELSDEVSAGSEFDQFRDRLQKAIKDRDADFIRALIPPEGLFYGFGGPLAIADMELGDADSWFWQELEKMMALDSCEPSDYPAVEAGNQTWVCPNTTQAFYRQYPPPAEAEGIEYEFEIIMVMGKNVNVRAAPNTNSPVVGILTNELVTFDQPTATRLYQQSADQRPGALKGWTPVVLPNDVQGYVHNRYTYAPLSPRGVFENVSGQWQIVRVLAGD